jgi:hypothetical protein
VRLVEHDRDRFEDAQSLGRSVPPLSLQFLPRRVASERRLPESWLGCAVITRRSR